MKFLLSALICAALFTVFAADAVSQSKDHLTAPEVELVRDVQDVDLRMKIFAKAIDRRLLVINGTGSLTPKELKSLEKDKEKWGELPDGTKSKMIADIAGILNESIDKFEDVYEREPKSELIPFAYHHIADYCDILIPRLKKISGMFETRVDRGSLGKSYEYCKQILSVREKIPRPKKKKPKRKPRY